MKQLKFFTKGLLTAHLMNLQCPASAMHRTMIFGNAWLKVADIISLKMILVFALRAVPLKGPYETVGCTVEPVMVRMLGLMENSPLKIHELLLLLVFGSCKCAVNPVTNPNRVSGHSYMCQNLKCHLLHK
jgi:hypothetical protein